MLGFIWDTVKGALWSGRHIDPQVRRITERLNSLTQPYFPNHYWQAFGNVGSVDGANVRLVGGEISRSDFMRLSGAFADQGFHISNFDSVTTRTKMKITSDAASSTTTARPRFDNLDPGYLANKHDALIASLQKEMSSRPAADSSIKLEVS